MRPVPDIDHLVALEAVLRQGRSTFTTMDIADHVRRQHRESALARRSNAQVGRFLSDNRTVLLITPRGGGGAHGQGWERHIGADVARSVLRAIEQGWHHKALRQPPAGATWIEGRI